MWVVGVCTQALTLSHLPSLFGGCCFLVLTAPCTSLHTLPFKAHAPPSGLSQAFSGLQTVQSSTQAPDFLKPNLLSSSRCFPFPVCQTSNPGHPLLSLSSALSSLAQDWPQPAPPQGYPWAIPMTSLHLTSYAHTFSGQSSTTPGPVWLDIPETCLRIFFKRGSAEHGRTCLKS